MTTHTCAVTGEKSNAKHYILRTTDCSEELISPDALFGEPGKGVRETRLLKQLQQRIERLEDLFINGRTDVSDEVLGEAAQTADDVLTLSEDGGREDGDRIAEAAKKAAAPVKKAPGQRKASD